MSATSTTDTTTNPNKPVERTATGEPVASSLGQYSWALFEHARNPYVGLVYIFVFAPYFANYVVGDPIKGQEIWSLTNTITGVCVAIFAPFLGAVSDRMGRRKPWVVGFSIPAIPLCFLLWYAMPGAAGGLSVPTIALIIIVLTVTLEFTAIFHNAMLPSLVSDRQIGWLSGVGVGVGNAGTMITLIIMLFFIALPASGDLIFSFMPEQPILGLDPEMHEHSRAAGPMSGLWWLLFTIPFVFLTPDRKSTSVKPVEAIREGIEQVWKTVKRARELSNVGLYLLARMLYNDGLIAMLAYSGIVAAGVFKWDLTAMLLFALSLNPFSVSGGFFGGWLDRKFGAKRAIQISLVGCAIFLVGAISVSRTHYLFFFEYDPETAAPLWNFPYFQTLPEVIFIVCFMAQAVMLPAVQAASRGMMARLSPPSMSSQFFGLFALSGTATAFLGHALVTLFTRISGNQQVGFASVLLLLVAGAFVLTKVREERAQDVY